MARLVFGMLQSLDGFVDHEAYSPDPELFDHFIAQTEGLAGSIYGRRLYGIMRYWDEDRPEWTEAEHRFADVWRRVPKWVVSTTLTEVGPNASLLAADVAARIRDLRDSTEGEMEVGGTVLASSLGELGLIDEYRIYLFPVATGTGTPYFNRYRPSLRLVDSRRIGREVVRLSYEPRRD